MYYLKNVVDATYIISKSKFIAYAFPCTSLEQSEILLKALRKEHPKANHFCYGINICNGHSINRSSDDNEPSGSAGIILLQCLLKFNIANTLLVVVRYFGGIKLGSGGLKRAYNHSGLAALKKATYYQLVLLKLYKLVFSYPLCSLVDHLLYEEDVIIKNKHYDACITYECVCNEELIKKVIDLTSGQIQTLFIQDEYVKKEIINQIGKTK